MWRERQPTRDNDAIASDHNDDTNDNINKLVENAIWTKDE
jgi:hypothetical protein